MEPWEALDVDESDLPSLVRPSILHPCKRHRPLEQPHESTTDIVSSSRTISLSLEHCSQLHCSSGSQTQIYNPETLDSQSDHRLPQIEVSQVAEEEEHQQQQQGPSSSSRRLLPGPAGALQAAMHRHARYRDQIFSSSQQQISTQEFLRKAHEGGDGDEDFGTNPWLCALDFLGGGDVALRSPLRPLKPRVGIEKLPQVVCVIKSCVPNGLGDLIVSLKYHTGTIGASIHHKVVTQSEFGKDISVGAVMILKEVAVFSPSWSACYLNITLDNVVKVFGKECGPPPKQNYHVSSDRIAPSDREQSKEVRPWMGERTINLRDRAAHEITAGFVRRDDDDNGTMEVDREMGDSDLGAGSFHAYSSSSSRKPHHAAEEVAVRTDSNSNEGKEVNTDRNPKNVTLGSFHGNGSEYENAPKVVDTYMVNDPNDREARKVNGVKKPPLISRNSLPEWTDEQLEELFATGSQEW